MWFRTGKTQEIYQKIKIMFLHKGIYLHHREHFGVVQLNCCIYLGYGGMLLQHFGLCSKFSIGDIPRNLIGYSIRFHCTCDYSVEEISSIMSPCWVVLVECMSFLCREKYWLKKQTTQRKRRKFDLFQSVASLLELFLESTYEFFLILVSHSNHYTRKFSVLV